MKTPKLRDDEKKNEKFQLNSTIIKYFTLFPKALFMRANFLSFEEMVSFSFSRSSRTSLRWKMLKTTITDTLHYLTFTAYSAPELVPPPGQMLFGLVAAFCRKRKIAWQVERITAQKATCGITQFTATSKSFQLPKVVRPFSKYRLVFFWNYFLETTVANN